MDCFSIVHRVAMLPYRQFHIRYNRTALQTDASVFAKMYPDSLYILLIDSHEIVSSYCRDRVFAISFVLGFSPREYDEDDYTSIAEKDRSWTYRGEKQYLSISYHR